MKMAQHQEVGRSVGGRGRGPRAAVDQRDLAEEVARPEAGQLAAVALDHDMASQDDKELLS